MCADVIQVEVDAGNEPTTREAIIIAKLAALNLTKPRQVIETKRADDRGEHLDIGAKSRDRP